MLPCTSLENSAEIPADKWTVCVCVGGGSAIKGARVEGLEYQTEGSLLSDGAFGFLSRKKTKSNWNFRKTNLGAESKKIHSAAVHIWDEKSLD